MPLPLAKAIIDTVKNRATDRQEAVCELASDELIGHVMDAYTIGLADGTARSIKIMREGMRPDLDGSEMEARTA